MHPFQETSIVSCEWTAKNMKDYLRVHGLNAVAILAICECANNCKTYKTLKEALELDPMCPWFVTIELECHSNPELFKMWEFLALWECGVCLHQHIDVAMHLLFLGIMKTTIQLIQEWMTKQGKHLAFLAYACGTFESVQRLGLDYCQCVPYKAGKLGGLGI